MGRILLRCLRSLIVFSLVFQLIGCGTILYPERKGQKTGRIDVGVAVLDGIGLLFFFVPGVIAYAVDFSTGTIYLPGTAKSALNVEDMRQVKFDPERSSFATIEQIVKKETGCDVHLNQGNMQIVRLKSTEDMMNRFAEVLPGIEASPQMLTMK